MSAEMSLTTLSKALLLEKCEQLGLKKFKSKNKGELIILINSHLALTSSTHNLVNNESEILETSSEKSKEENIECSSMVSDANNTPTQFKSKHQQAPTEKSFKGDNLKLINQINQLFHNKGVKQEDRFNLLINLLELNKENKTDGAFDDVMFLINSLDYNNYELIQEIFMTLGSKYTKFNLDQFYTPLNISKFISLFMDSREGNNAIDPAGGTGDLLLFYKGPKTIWDIDENALKLCKFNYDLNKQVNYNLVCKNSLDNIEESEGQYSYVVMNPPFGTNTIINDKTLLDKYELGRGKKTQEIGILFLELGMKLLKENGILFIIVPAGYVGNGNKNCSDMRDFILKNRLIASIALPEHTFKRSGTGVNTYLLIIQKKVISPETPYNIFISNVNNIGYNLNKKDTPLKYKFTKETGELVLTEEGLPTLDNDLIEVHSLLCKFITDNNITGINNECSNESPVPYEYININNLTSNILDIKRYTNSYISVFANLVSIGAVRLNTLCKIINTPTKIEHTKLYKYIDISEINSPLYGYKSLYGWELPSRAKYTLKKNDILVSKLEGTMSYCVILDDTDNYIATNGVSVIRPNNVEALYIIFSNIMTSNFTCQHKAYLTGSIMASLSDNDMESFLIDTISIDVDTTKHILDTLETLQRLRIK